MRFSHPRTSPCRRVSLRHVRLHQLVKAVGDPLRGLPKLLHRPIRGVALGHVAGPRVVDQTLGQRPRQHQLPLAAPPRLGFAASLALASASAGSSSKETVSTSNFVPSPGPEESAWGYMGWRK